MSMTRFDEKEGPPKYRALIPELYRIDVRPEEQLIGDALKCPDCDVPDWCVIRVVDRTGKKPSEFWGWCRCCGKTFTLKERK